MIIVYLVTYEVSGPGWKYQKQATVEIVDPPQDLVELETVIWMKVAFLQVGHVELISIEKLGEP